MGRQMRRRTSAVICARTFGTGKEKYLGDLHRVLEGWARVGRKSLGHSLQSSRVLFDGRGGSRCGAFSIEVGSICELRESASGFRTHDAGGRTGIVDSLAQYEVASEKHLERPRVDLAR